MIDSRYIWICLLLCLTSVVNVLAEPLQVVSYNVENLFHPKHDSILKSNPDPSPKEREVIVEKDDYEWTPDGERRWSYTRYYRKVENIARVLTNIGEWDGVDIIGLQEVENALCVKRLCYTMRKNEYDFVHYESPDRRGIDVALIYKKARIDTINSRVARVSSLETRDILYVCAKVDKKDTLHLFVCHLPSQRGGAAESEWKRIAAKEVLQEAIDSVLTIDSEAKIIVMGDFNSAPKEDLRGVSNRMQSATNFSVKEKAVGTHKHQGQWTCLDQFYTSPALDSLSTVTIYDAPWIQETDEKYLGLKPKRTYNGFQYRKDGFSDHLPIILRVSL